MVPAVHAGPLVEPAAEQRLFAHYDVLGVPITVASDVTSALTCVDETYTMFRQAKAAPAAAFTAELWRGVASDGTRRSGVVTVRDSNGYQQEWGSEQDGLIALLDRLVHGILGELHARGMYAVHAGALVYRGAALIVAGRSGQGKTTLTLGLLRRGLGLLSDEFAVLDPIDQRILPYRRSVHVRPGTPELIPELHFLNGRQQQRLGGGIEWSLTPAELAQIFPAGLALAAPLRYVLLLDGPPQPGATPSITPAPAALAAIELLRGTWAASRDFAGGLARLSRLMDGTMCARLRTGALEPTLDMIAAWLEAHRG